MLPKELHERMAQDAESVCRKLLPNGKRVGSEWCVGSVRGEEGLSLKVKLVGNKAGIWADFSNSQRGDMIDLVREVQSTTMRDAINWCKSYCGIKEEKFNAIPAPKKAVPLKPLAVSSVADFAVKWFEDRGIKKDTLEVYKVVSDGTKVSFPFYADGELYFVKHRDVAKPKKEAFSVSTGATPILFGWQAVDDNDREIVITEGECDAMAYFEQGIAALSIPMGAGTGAKHAWIDQEWERMERFDTIYLSMDMDEPGILTAEYLAARLGLHRCRIITLPTKDANDALLKGVSLLDCKEAAKYIEPPEIRGGNSFLEDVIKAFNPTDERMMGSALPWTKTTEKFRMRQGEVTIWTGWNGSGKSMVLSHVACHLIRDGDKVAIASMEMMPGILLKRMFQQIGAEEHPSDEYINAINDWVTGNLWIVNIRGTAKTDRLLELCTYCWKRFGVTQVIIDSLAKCGMNEDDYNGQKGFVDRLTDFAKNTACHVHLVAHSRKGESENTPVGKLDVKGTGALTDMVDNVISVWRNKPKEAIVQVHLENSTAIPEAMRGKADCILAIQKQRNFDFEGKIALWFDVKTHQYLSGPDFKPRPILEHYENQGH